MGPGFACEAGRLGHRAAGERPPRRRSGVRVNEPVALAVLFMPAAETQAARVVLDVAPENSNARRLFVAGLSLRLRWFVGPVLIRLRGPSNRKSPREKILPHCPT